MSEERFRGDGETCWLCEEVFTEDAPLHARGLHHTCFARLWREWAKKVQAEGYIERFAASMKGEVEDD